VERDYLATAPRRQAGLPHFIFALAAFTMRATMHIANCPNNNTPREHANQHTIPWQVTGSFVRRHSHGCSQ